MDFWREFQLPDLHFELSRHAGHQDERRSTSPIRTSELGRTTGVVCDRQVLELSSRQWRQLALFSEDREAHRKDVC